MTLQNGYQRKTRPKDAAFAASKIASGEINTLVIPNTFVTQEEIVFAHTYTCHLLLAINR